MPCSSIVSGFVIFTHRIFVYQMWMLLKQCKNRDEVIIIIIYSKLWNLLCFLADKSWNGKTITKTIQVTYINYDTVISWIETLGLIHMCIGFTDYLYMYIKRLVFELNSYRIALFIAERRFVMILYWVTNVSPLILWRDCTNGHLISDRI